MHKSSQPHFRLNEALSLANVFVSRDTKEIHDSLIGWLSAVTATDGQMSSNDIMLAEQITQGITLISGKLSNIKF